MVVRLQTMLKNEYIPDKYANFRITILLLVVGGYMLTLVGAQSALEI